MTVKYRNGVLLPDGRTNGHDKNRISRYSLASVEFAQLVHDKIRINRRFTVSEFVRNSHRKASLPQNLCRVLNEAYNIQKMAAARKKFSDQSRAEGDIIAGDEIRIS